MQEKKSLKVPCESPRARVLRWLEESLETGRFQRGAELPTEREIAKIVGVAAGTAAMAMDEAEERGLAVRRHPGARRRYAGTVGADTFASSSVFVLGSLRNYADITKAPGWSDAMISFEVARRISLSGRPVSLLNSDSLSNAALDAAFKSRPGAFVVANAVRGEESAMRTLSRCREAGIPAVAYGNAPELRCYDRAYSDHRAGSRELTRWLIAHGRKRIVPFFPFAPTRFWEHERLEGYAEAMREAGFEPLPSRTFCMPGIQAPSLSEYFRINTAMALSALIAQRRAGEEPDAILCPSDDWAKPVIAAVQELGLVPNRDIIVAGYDNMVRGSGFDEFESLRPAVTVDKHNERSAEDLAALVLARMEGTLPPEPQARIHEHELVVLSPEFINK
jgi:DNA-binding LacI/PurR family transcriptional regulator